MATKSPYENPTPRLKALAFAFSFLALSLLAAIGNDPASVRAMLVG